MTVLTLLNRTLTDLMLGAKMLLLSSRSLSSPSFQRPLPVVGGVGGRGGMMVSTTSNHTVSLG